MSIFFPPFYPAILDFFAVLTLKNSLMNTYFLMYDHVNILPYQCRLLIFRISVGFQSPGKPVFIFRTSQTTAIGYTHIVMSVEFARFVPGTGVPRSLRRSRSIRSLTVWKSRPRLLNSNNSSSSGNRLAASNRQSLSRPCLKPWASSSCRTRMQGPVTPWLRP